MNNDKEMRDCMDSQRVMVDRLDALEKRNGVELNVNAFLDYDEYDNQFFVKVIGEIFGEMLETDLKLVFSIYNENGEIIGTEHTYVYSESFEGIDSFSQNVYAPKGENIARVRVYPQKS
ncbi:hypothetical protein [Bacillus thuringiensis]|uniref:hypothetical protein n=1 Tax=Bacillus thuringiensis TaxID=1428 RepID=UPI003BF7E2F5